MNQEPVDVVTHRGWRQQLATQKRSNDVSTLVRGVAAALLLLGSVHAAAAQSADEIVEKHLEAIGGRAALGKLTSRVMTGTIVLSTPAGEFSGPIEVMNQTPNKVRTLINLDLSAVGVGKITVDQRFDGATGYVIDTLQGNRDIEGDQLEGMRNGYFPSPFLNYKNNGVALELVGKDKVGERDVYVVIVKAKTGPAPLVYFDATTFEIVRQVVKLNVAPVGEIEQTTDFSDERVVDGVKVPHKIVSTSAVQSFTVTVGKVEQNGALDQTLFVKP